MGTYKGSHNAVRPVLSNYQGYVEMKDELACDSVTFEAVDFQVSCLLAGDTGIVL